MCHTCLTVPAGHGRTFRVRQGQFITVIDSEGQQAADFVAVNADNHDEKLSPVHTRQHLRSLFFKPGDALWSSENRPMLRIVADTIGIHDANVPACDRTRFSVDFGVEGHRNCVDNLLEGMKAHGITYFTLPEPFNLFQNGPVTADGRMEVTDPHSKAGDHIVFEALCDLICAVSSCPQDIIPGNGLQVTPIDIVIHDRYSAEVRHAVNA
ncbi:MULTISPECIES: DUF1989 domain-containing protein [Pantoea]|uniref:DUF1989 domain-containing protein n=1 Tax=Pantoea TaxID=53335 RepID=UPI000660274E|nr:MULTISPECIES: urea carboxylase-associated family protein [Pantoea]MBS6436875.1 urea carboxylase-associated family protein [Pantoea sp.]MDU2730180.1 urea carboxylase-associated family protein [Pantoea sp.]MDU6079177.1 urea carboxylase-associated family protein [Pantoea sp.]